MDLAKQYIIQCIISAANNLRLSTEKIEVVALLREQITIADDLEKEIAEMKKVTELSTFAIRLNEVYNYIAKGKVDFLKVTDKFKEHSHFLVRDLNSLLEKMNPHTYRKSINDRKEKLIQEEIKPEEQITEEIKQVISEEQPVIEDKTPEQPEKKVENEKLKEEFILQEEEKAEDLLFEKYEERILTPIKELDSFLKKISPTNLNESELQRYYEVMNRNAELSSRIGFEIIANMHRIFASGLYLMMNRTLMPVKEVIEGLRACLIVIVAVVRGKEVDISNYLNRAESFGYSIQNIK